MLFNDQVGCAIPRAAEHTHKILGGSIDRYISRMQEVGGCKAAKKPKQTPAIEVLNGGCLLITPSWRHGRQS